MTVCCSLSESLNASGLIAWVIEMSSQEDTRWLNRSQPNGIPIMSFWSRVSRSSTVLGQSPNYCYHVMGLNHSTARYLRSMQTTRYDF